MENLAPDNSLNPQNASRISIGGCSIPKSAECGYERDLEGEANYSQNPSSGAPSIHEGDFKEKQVS